MPSILLISTFVKAKREKITLTIIKKFQSSYINLELILIFEKKSARPKTRPKFAMFEPITFEIAISLEFFRTELILIKSSGAEVAIETTVNPITTFEILYFSDRSTEDFKR